MSTNKTFNKVQLDVKFTQATTRANLISEENISISFGKISKYFADLHSQAFTGYTHPSHTSYSSGLYKVTVDGLGHVSAATAATKADIPALDYLPNTTKYALSDSVGGSAKTADKLTTARTIAIGTGVTSTATSFDGSANITIPVTGIKEAYLTWGGKDFSSSFSPLDAALEPRLGANRLEMCPGSGIKIERTTDGGTTWTEVPTSSISNAQRSTLFSSSSGYSVPVSATSTAGMGTDAAKYMMRITLDTSVANVYTSLLKFILNISTNGCANCYVKLRIRTAANVTAGNDTWLTWDKTNKAWASSPTEANTKCPIGGWSGYNVINFTPFTTYGNNTSQYRNVQFIFGCSKNDSTSSGLSIINIQGYGGVAWNAPSNMARTGHLYSWNGTGAATFPSSVTATDFTGKINTMTITGTTSGSYDLNTFLTEHPTITKSADTTSTVSPAHGGTFTVVDSITRETNGHVTKINTKTVTLPAGYSHPTYTSKSNGLYKITVDSLGHVSAATAVAKADITALGIPGSDTNTTYTFATGDAVGQIKVTPSGGTATNYNVNGIAAGTNSGTTKHLAYYSSATTIASVGNILYSVEDSEATTPMARTILHIYGPTVGNNEGSLISGVKGVLSYGDGGPQINFSTSETIGGGQASALIWTDNDSAASGASWHFVSSQTDWNVISKRFHARTGISIGTDLPQTSYNLYVNGTSFHSDTITFGSASNIVVGSAINIYTRATSTYSSIVKWSNGDTWGTRGAEIGYHNTGGDSTNPGTICVLPYQTEANPWDGQVGLFIKKDHVYIDGVELSKTNHTHNNYLGAVKIGNYWGMAWPDGTDKGTNSWIRTTRYGIIPYAANSDTTDGNASSLGTSTWTFLNGYIDNLYYKDLKTVTVVAGNTADNSIDKMSGSFFFSGNNLLGETYDWVGIQAGYSADKWQMTGHDGHPLFRHNDSGGTNTAGWSDWKGCLVPDTVTGSDMISVTKTTTTVGSGGSAYAYDSGVDISIIPYAKNISNGDWNAATTNGWYMGSSCTNAPSTAWWIGRVIAHNNKYCIQEIWQFTASTNAYKVPHKMRMFVNNVWGDWADVTVGAQIPEDAIFTDENVLQSNTATANYRPIMFGATNSSTIADLSATITGQAYVSTQMFAKPSIGYMYATCFSTTSYLDGTGAQLSPKGLYLRSVCEENTGTKYSYSRYAIRTYPGKLSSNDGMLLDICGGGLTIVGSGESATSLAALIDDDQTVESPARLNVGGTLNTSFTGSNEYLILSSDQSMYFLTNCNTVANRMPVVLDTDSYFYPGTTKTGSLGTSSYYWGSAYIDSLYLSKTSELNTASGNALYFATRTDTNVSISFGVGAGGVNHGIYSYKLGGWMVYGDASNVYVRTSLYNPSSTVDLYALPLLGGEPSTGTHALYNNNGFRYSTLEGTTSALGLARLVLGNGTGSGTAGNKRGSLRLYSAGTNYIDLIPDTTNSSQTITIPATTGSMSVLRKALITDSSSDFASYAWHKFADATFTSANYDYIITFLATLGYGSVAKNIGLLTMHVRLDGNKVISTSSSQLEWTLATEEIDPNNFVLVYTNTSGTSCKVELWYKQSKRYDGYTFTIINENNRTNKETYSMNLYDEAGHGQANLPSATGTIVSSLGRLKNAPGVYIVKGTQTASTSSWTGKIDVSELYDGLTIAYYLPYASTSTASTLNLTLSDGTTTGAINCYWNTSSRITTHYGAGSTILLTYWSAGSISISGTATTDNRWTRCDYNVNNNVTQNISTGDGKRPLLMSYYQTGVTTTSAQVTYRNDSIYAIASTGSLYATKFYGNITSAALNDAIYQLYATSESSTFNGTETLITSLPSSSGTATPSYQRITINGFIKKVINDLKEPVLYENTTNPTASATVSFNASLGTPKYLKLFIKVIGGSSYSSSSGVMNVVDIDPSQYSNGCFVGHGAPGSSGVPTYLTYICIIHSETSGQHTYSCVKASTLQLSNGNTPSNITANVYITKVIAVY